jgi:D-xylose transport system substrate-binding protein
MKRTICMMLVILLFLCGCFHLPPKRGETGKSSEGAPLIGLSMCSLLVQRWYSDMEMITANLTELGAQVLAQNANNDYETQYKQVEYMVKKGIDVLILIATDSNRCKNIVEFAKREGVKVITYERLIKDADVDAHYSFDNIKVGELMAQCLVKKMDKGNVFFINGDKNDYNSELYRIGYLKVLQPYIENGNIQVVGDKWAENWKKELAFQYIEQALASGVKINGIVAENDSLAEMAIEALSEAGLAGELTYIVGQDGDLAACQRIVKGTQLCTVYKPYDQLTFDVSSAAYRLAAGEKLDIREEIFNGTKNIPYYRLEPTLIAKYNLRETIIEKGIYHEDDVY